MRKTTLSLLLFALSFLANAEDELSLVLPEIKGEDSDRAIPANISTTSELGSAATYTGAERVARIPYQSYQQLTSAKGQWQQAAVNWQREWRQIEEHLYASIGLALNVPFGRDDELNKIYYASSTRLYLEFGYQSSIGVGLRLLGMQSHYYMGDGETHYSSTSDDDSSYGLGYGIHFNLLPYLTIGMNKIGLTESLQFDNFDYNPGVITETVLGLHSHVGGELLGGVEYVRISEEQDQLRNNDSSISIMVRYRVYD